MGPGIVNSWPRYHCEIKRLRTTTVPSPCFLAAQFLWPPRRLWLLLKTRLSLPGRLAWPKLAPLPAPAFLRLPKLRPPCQDTALACADDGQVGPRRTQRRQREGRRLLRNTEVHPPSSRPGPEGSGVQPESPASYCPPTPTRSKYCTREDNKGKTG